MKKPNRLIDLVAELRKDAIQTSVVTINTSNATLFFSGEPDGLDLTSEECELLLDSPDTVQQMFEALNEPSDASIELHDVSVEDEVMDTLNELFSSVDVT